MSQSYVSIAIVALTKKKLTPCLAPPSYQSIFTLFFTVGSLNLLVVFHYVNSSSFYLYLIPLAVYLV